YVHRSHRPARGSAPVRPGPAAGQPGQQCRDSHTQKAKGEGRSGQRPRQKQRMSSGYIAAASFAQRQLRYLDLLQPGRTDYALPLLIEISAPVNEASLRQAFKAVIQRHDVLRASFPLVDDTPVQTVHDDLDVPLPGIMLPGKREQWLQGMRNTLSTLASQGLNLEQGPVVAARLFVPEQPLEAGCSMA